MHESKHPVRSVFHLSLLIHNLSKELERRTGLSLSQWSLLVQLLDMPGTSAQEFSQALGVDPSTLSQGLKKLGGRGFLLVTEDPRDSRKKIISLTRAGKQALDAAEPEIRRIAGVIDGFASALQAVREGIAILRETTTQTPRKRIPDNGKQL